MRLSVFHSPTCVGVRYGRGSFFATRLFSTLAPATSCLAARLRQLGSAGGFASRLHHLAALAPALPPAGWPSRWRPPFAPKPRYRNVDRLSIACALRLRLRPD